MKISDIQVSARPTGEVFAYRAHVDEHMRALVRRIGDDAEHPALPVIELGLHHEQQHQELLLTDIKHVFWMNPLRPAYAPRGGDELTGRLTTDPLKTQNLDPAGPSRISVPRWHSVPEGVYRIGHEGDGFAFDNEGPAHRVFLESFRLASRVVTNGVSGLDSPGRSVGFS